MNANELYKMVETEEEYMDKWELTEICRHHLPEVVEANDNIL